MYRSLGLSLLVLTPLLSVQRHVALAQDVAVTGAVPGSRAPQVEELLARLRDGTRRANELVPIYLALARRFADSGYEERARHAFTVLLALAPAFRLSPSETDEVRAPYLEARGFWEAQGLPFGASCDTDADRAHMVAHISDPAGLAARVRIRVKHVDTGRYVENVLPIAPEITVALPRTEDSARPIEYSLALLDEHGNRLFERGTDDAPILVAAVAASALPPPQTTVPPEPTLATPPPVSAAAPAHEVRRGYPLLASVSLAVAAGALGGGAVAHFRREHFADIWNRATCSGDGITRGERCQDERSRIDALEIAAGSLYAVGGAALTFGLAALLWPRRETEGPPTTPGRALSFACGAGPSWFSLTCTARH